MAAVACSLIEKQVRAWLEQFVVGLNLCPFAAPVVSSDGLRIKVCESSDIEQIMQMFLAELDLIQSTSELDIATTLLAIPNALSDFDDYLDAIDLAESLLSDAGLEGIIQLASFHPNYQFAEESAESASHFSNRSPYPLIHFLREDMMARALGSFPNPETIPIKNISILESIGREEIERRWNKIAGDGAK
ncbi:MAG: DUF1415 domain-containing protein [Porticoccaceae bacterium]|nr:DUF1415 domain-containing protein [Porticoccaceae bacterium]